jgi:hypothetical protein
MLTRQERNRAIRVAEALWRDLDNHERWGLGDQLVLGDFDWMDWFSDPPPKGTIAALDKLRIEWEGMI